MKNKIYFIFTILFVVGGLGFLIYQRIQKESNQTNSEEHQVKVDKNIVPVKTIKLTKKDLSVYIKTTGKAQTDMKVEIRSKISGDITDIKAQNNKFVKKGDLILSIDDYDYQLAFKRAKNNLISAKIEYDIRKEQDRLLVEQKDNNQEEIKKLKKELQNIKMKLKKEGLISSELQRKQDDLEISLLLLNTNRDMVMENASGLSEAIINYKKAKKDLENCDIKAPFSGYIYGLTAVKGENISLATPICNIVNAKRIKMVIPILESEIADVKKGRSVEVEFPAFTRKFKGNISEISPVVNAKTKTCNITVYMDNSDNTIKPGMVGDVTIVGRIYKNLLVIPKSALLNRDNRDLVFVEEQGVAKWVYVHTGKENYHSIEIIKGVKEGVNIIVSNNYTLAHDANVKVIN